MRIVLKHYYLLVACDLGLALLPHSHSSDNVKLYEKIKYVQSYQAGEGSSSDDAVKRSESAYVYLHDRHDSPQNLPTLVKATHNCELRLARSGRLYLS